MKVFVLGAALLASSVSFALPAAGFSAIQQAVQTEDQPTAEQEAERLNALRQAKSMEEAMQFMTPDEIAAELEIPDESEMDPSLLFTPANEGGGWLKINVSIANQTMTMFGSETLQFDQVVSTGKKGYSTVRGCYNPWLLSKNHWSRKYNSPMPWAVFFYKGYALHETPYVKALGTKASHGCVRQSGKNAKYVYETVAYYVKNYGTGSVTICVD